MPVAIASAAYSQLSPRSCWYPNAPGMTTAPLASDELELPLLVDGTVPDMVTSLVPPLHPPSSVIQID